MFYYVLICFTVFNSITCLPNYLPPQRGPNILTLRYMILGPEAQMCCESQYKVVVQMLRCAVNRNTKCCESQCNCSFKLITCRFRRAGYTRKVILLNTVLLYLAFLYDSSLRIICILSMYYAYHYQYS